MPLVQAALAVRIAKIISHSYFNDAGAPLYVFSTRQVTVIDAANAWADALVSYCLTATAAGVVAVPAALTARQPAMASMLASQFAINNDPLGAATAIFNALGALWFAPPVAFPNGYLITQVEAGKAAAISAMAELGAVVSSVSLHRELAGIIDVYLKTIVATLPGAPPVPVTLL